MRILLVKTSSLGDVVHNLPVASDLRARFPEASIDWVVEEGYADIPRLHPAISRVIPMALRRWRRSLLSAASWREMAAFRRDLRMQTYDLVLDSQGLIKSGLIAAQARLAQGGRRAGFSAEAAREPLVARFYDAGFAIPRNVHAVPRNRWLAAAACGFEPDLPLDYGIVAVPLAAAWLPPRPYAVLLTATSRADKEWPDGDWLGLARALAARGLGLVLPAGTAAEREHAAALAGRMINVAAAVSVAPPLSLKELAGLLKGAALIVGVDTGLTHLAAALGRPTLALFSASEPALTGVHGDALARNLGGKGTPAAAAETIAAAAELLALGQT